MSEPSYVEFRATDEERFEKLRSAMAALVGAKESDEWRDDEYWLGFFDEAARGHFWWTTEAEAAEHSRRWLATPVEQRFTDPSLETPWDFGSMIDAFRNGDYLLLGIRTLSDGVTRIEFDPFGYPYGGMGCMVAIVEAFGFRVTGRRE